MSIRVDSKEMQAALRKLVTTVNDETAKTLGDEGHNLLERANATAPVKTGQLKASGFVQHDKRRKAIEVGYTAEYAAAVHERSHDEESEQWFKKAVDTFRSEFEERIAKRIEAALRRGTK